mmetsp:Transcript_17279/g.15256  ORF Transcript_17279/g.15256 Transcript_17279/m.15256 type:complete len:125 (+) Transcript_17279:775-1149(+)
MKFKIFLFIIKQLNNENEKMYHQIMHIRNKTRQTEDLYIHKLIKINEIAKEKRISISNKFAEISKIKENSFKRQKELKAYAKVIEIKIVEDNKVIKNLEEDNKYYGAHIQEILKQKQKLLTKVI